MTSRTVRVTTTVSLGPADSFEIFTRDIGRWWRRQPRFRVFTPAAGQLAFEGGEGGRLIARLDDGGVIEIGAVLVWKPGERVVFEWRGGLADADERTEVDVRFVARGPDSTEVILEHRGWRADRLQQAFVDRLGLWWGDLLTAYRGRCV